MMQKVAEAGAARGNFITEEISRDLANAAPGTSLVTRFPPEPNGYLHIGHAKAICLNFGLAESFPGARCNLRFDDTNPEKESQEYVNGIMEDVSWLGYRWHGEPLHASDYFQQLHDYAITLIRKGLAYVDSLDPESIREYRGTPTSPGKNSPYRDRDAEENLRMFEKMRDGECAEGECVLRARIDMAAANINMRDPVIYRIRQKRHYRTGDRWHIYPMYDFTQCVSDALEGVTHSLCTLEFEDHRPLYEWFISKLPVPHKPRQIEFARMNLGYTITSKRMLTRLVQEGHVDGWDDPRMPTLCGMRRRGIPPAAIRDFCQRVGITKKDALIDPLTLENCVREELNQSAPRTMAVLDPVRLVIEDYPAGKEEQLEAPNHPDKPELGKRAIPFCAELLVSRDDVADPPPSGWRRLSPGREVRLRHGYLVTCREVLRDPASGEITEVRCSHDQESRGGVAPDGRKVKGAIHWVSARHAAAGSARLYDRLCRVPEPLASGEDWLQALNPRSMQLKEVHVEPGLATSGHNVWQFERCGYFCLDQESRPDKLVFNRVVSLRDTWNKQGGC